MDEPLLIVLDEDDFTDDDEHNADIISTEVLLPPANQQATDSSSNVCRPAQTTTKCARVNNEQNNARQSGNKALSRRKPGRPSSPTDSILSTVSFDDKSDVLTISRMGCIYYCLENLYLKIFSSFCTLEELTDVLVRSGVVLLKQVTLSEKIAIEEQMPEIKSSSLIRYRLISINFSDYLCKLRELLRHNQTEQHFDEIIEIMRREKDKGAKRISTDDEEVAQPRKRLKIIKKQRKINKTPAIDIPISRDRLTTNNTAASSNIFSPYNYPEQSAPGFNSDKNTSTKYSLNKSRISSYPAKRCTPVDRSIFQSQNVEISNSLSALSISPGSLPSNGTQHQPPINAESSNYLTEDNSDMPRIVHVEENVEIHKQIYDSTNQGFYSEQPMSSLSNDLYRSGSQQCHDNLSASESSFNLPAHRRLQSSNEPSINYVPIRSNPSVSPGDSTILSSILMPIQRQPITPHPNTHQFYCISSSSKSDPPHSFSHQNSLIRFLRPPTPENNLTGRVQTSSALLSPPNTPNEFNFPNTLTRSVHIQQAIADHGYSNMDRTPKLLIRHTKVYLKRTIDTTGHLFPTWFNKPDWRCIHCFSCDQVFTPQQFMTHIDDERMLNESLLNMSSIKLLASEKLSDNKLALWNQFCFNLSIYTKQSRSVGLSNIINP